MSKTSLLVCAIEQCRISIVKYLIEVHCFNIIDLIEYSLYILAVPDKLPIIRYFWEKKLLETHHLSIILNTALAAEDSVLIYHSNPEQSKEFMNFLLKNGAVMEVYPVDITAKIIQLLA